MSIGIVVCGGREHTDVAYAQTRFASVIHDLDRTCQPIEQEFAQAS